MPTRWRLRTLALVACLAAASTAAQPGQAEDVSPANVAAARRHFEKAKAYYGQGAYREAINELEAAHALDPTAKDLVFNLGVVHEKLGDIDDALKWFRLYTTMALTPQERDRADAYVRRLEGAKKEVEDKQRQAARQSEAQRAEQAASAQPSSTAPPPAESAPEHGRIDAATITAATFTGAGLVFGVVLGIKALRDRPRSDYVTGRDGTYDDLTAARDQSSREARMADVGFAVSIAAAVTTAVLYFGRTKDPAPAPASASTSVSGAPLPGGGALFVQGSF
jgi:tetratricopeptide (TPR) repeat protein